MFPFWKSKKTGEIYKIIAYGNHIPNLEVLIVLRNTETGMVETVFNAEINNYFDSCSLQEIEDAGL